MSSKCRTNPEERFRRPACRINAAFRLVSERRIYAAAKNFVTRPSQENEVFWLCFGEKLPIALEAECSCVEESV